MPSISSAKVARACSAVSKVKLEVRYMGAECSRWFDLEGEILIDSVSKCLLMGFWLDFIHTNQTDLRKSNSKAAIELKRDYLKIKPIYSSRIG